MDQQLTPCEETLMVRSSRRQLTIGIPAEDPDEETRAPLTPQGVEVLTAKGHKVLMQRGAGLSSRFSDEQYAQAGATMTDCRRQTLEADLVLKVSPPTEEDAAQMGPEPTVACLTGRHARGKEAFRRLAAQKATIIATDAMTDVPGAEPALAKSLGEMEGQMAIATAARLLEATGGGKGVIVGGVTGVPPTEVVIIGSGMAALTAARTANALGAYVKVFDSSHNGLQSLSTGLAHHIFTSVMHPQAITKALRSADVVVGTRARCQDDGCYIPDEYLSLLKHEAVIVDLDTTNGGRTEASRPTTLARPAYRHGNIIFHCLPDITVLAPHTATIVMSDILAPLISILANEGSTASAARFNPQVQSAIAMYKGSVTNRDLAKKSGLEHLDIKLLLI